MAATVHLYEIFIRASCQQVWDALTDPGNTVRFFHGTRFESSGTVGEPFKYVISRSPGGVQNTGRRIDTDPRAPGQLEYS